jgi:cobalt/nickel transport system permease protein
VRHLRQQHTEGAVAASVDPRSRLLAAALLLGLVVSSTGSAFPWQVACICLPVALIAGMTPKVLILRLLHPCFIATVILALKTFMGPGQTIGLFSFGTYSVAGHPDGIREGILISSRIMGAVSVAVLLSQVMTFTETMAALAWLKVPRGLIDVSMFAWRSLFMLYDDAGVVYTAQKNRLGYCGMRRGLRSFGAMAGMLIIRAFDNSQAITTAMTQRGYDGSLPQMRRTRLGGFQLTGLCIFAVAATAAWKLQN